MESPTNQDATESTINVKNSARVLSKRIKASNKPGSASDGDGSKLLSQKRRVVRKSMRNSTPVKDRMDNLEKENPGLSAKEAPKKSVRIRKSVRKIARDESDIEMRKKFQQMAAPNSKQTTTSNTLQLATGSGAKRESVRIIKTSLSTRRRAYLSGQKDASDKPSEEEDKTVVRKVSRRIKVKSIRRPSEQNVENQSVDKPQTSPSAHGQFRRIRASQVGRVLKKEESSTNETNKVFPAASVEDGGNSLVPRTRKLRMSRIAKFGNSGASAEAPGDVAQTASQRTVSIRRVKRSVRLAPAKQDERASNEMDDKSEKTGDVGTEEKPKFRRSVKVRVSSRTKAKQTDSASLLPLPGEKQQSSDKQVGEETPIGRPKKLRISKYIKVQDKQGSVRRVIRASARHTAPLAERIKAFKTAVDDQSTGQPSQYRKKYLGAYLKEGGEHEEENESETIRPVRKISKRIIRKSCRNAPSIRTRSKQLQQANVEPNAELEKIRQSRLDEALDSVTRKPLALPKTYHVIPDSENDSDAHDEEESELKLQVVENSQDEAQRNDLLQDEELKSHQNIDIENKHASDDSHQLNQTNTNAANNEPIIQEIETREIRNQSDIKSIAESFNAERKEEVSDTYLTMEYSDRQVSMIKEDQSHISETEEVTADSSKSKVRDCLEKNEFKPAATIEDSGTCYGQVITSNTEQEVKNENTVVEQASDKDLFNEKGLTQSDSPRNSKVNSPTHEQQLQHKNSTTEDTSSESQEVLEIQTTNEEEHDIMPTVLSEGQVNVDNKQCSHSTDTEIKTIPYDTCYGQVITSNTEQEVKNENTVVERASDIDLFNEKGLTQSDSPRNSKVNSPTHEQQLQHKNSTTEDTSSESQEVLEIQTTNEEEHDIMPTVLSEGQVNVDNKQCSHSTDTEIQTIPYDTCYGQVITSNTEQEVKNENTVVERASDTDLFNEKGLTQSDSPRNSKVNSPTHEQQLQHKNSTTEDTSSESQEVLEIQTTNEEEHDIMPTVLSEGQVNVDNKQCSHSTDTEIQTIPYNTPSESQYEKCNNTNVDVIYETHTTEQINPNNDVQQTLDENVQESTDDAGQQLKIQEYQKGETELETVETSSNIDYKTVTEKPALATVASSERKESPSSSLAGENETNEEKQNTFYDSDEKTSIVAYPDQAKEEEITEDTINQNDKDINIEKNETTQHLKENEIDNDDSTWETENKNQQIENEFSAINQNDIIRQEEPTKHLENVENVGETIEEQNNCVGIEQETESCLVSDKHDEYLKETKTNVETIHKEIKEYGVTQENDTTNSEEIEEPNDLSSQQSLLNKSLATTPETESEERYVKTEQTKEAPNITQSLSFSQDESNSSQTGEKFSVNDLFDSNQVANLNMETEEENAEGLVLTEKWRKKCRAKYIHTYRKHAREAQQQQDYKREAEMLEKIQKLQAQPQLIPQDFQYDEAHSSQLTLKRDDAYSDASEELSDRDGGAENTKVEIVKAETAPTQEKYNDDKDDKDVEVEEEYVEEEEYEEEEYEEDEEYEEEEYEEEEYEDEEEYEEEEYEEEEEDSEYDKEEVVVYVDEDGNEIEVDEDAEFDEDGNQIIYVTDSEEEEIGSDEEIVYEDEDGNLVDADGNPIDEDEVEVVEEEYSDDGEEEVIYMDEDGNYVDADGNIVEYEPDSDDEVIEE